MKKKLISGFSMLFLLTLVSVSSPVSATFVGHEFSEDYFAVEVDLRTTDPTSPDLIRDLFNSSAATGDSNEWEDVQFYMAYMNSSGIEAAYSALEKIEHNITLGEIFEPSVETVLRLNGYGNELDESVFHVNATAPFQQLVQHYATPWGEDVFVTNNFMTLIAYSANETDRTMDASDQLFIGYTFSVQELIDAVNDELVVEYGPSAYQIGHFDYEPRFETTANGYRFGINYTNMFVLWQPIEVVDRGIDVFGVGAGFANPNPGGIIFGSDIVAASVLDFIDFTYEFETTEINYIGTDVVLGTVTTHYNIGETNFLVVKESTIDPDGNYTFNPFVRAPVYTLVMPDGIAGQTIAGTYHVPTSVDIPLPELAFYLDDDAKKRMQMTNGFGLTVATATTTFGIGVDSATYNDDLDNETNPTIGLEAGGNTYFYTDFAGKYSYHLHGLNKEPWNLNPATERTVEIHLFDPTNWDFVAPEPAKAYFELEFDLAYSFTKWVALQLKPGLAIPGDAGVYFTKIVYLTFTEFPEWFGGEIVHDPAYSAVAALAAQPGDTSGDEPGPTSGPISGFELLPLLLAIPPLVALYRKRR